jgi:hypothetical protein
LLKETVHKYEEPLQFNGINFMNETHQWPGAQQYSPNRAKNRLTLPAPQKTDSPAIGDEQPLIDQTVPSINVNSDSEDTAHEATLSDRSVTVINSPIDGIQPPPDSLVTINSAFLALDEASRVDEAKAIRDRAIGLEEYAKQAKDLSLLRSAITIRVRAERRAGEMLIEMAKKGERDNGKGNRNAALKSRAGTPKLSDIGITKSQSSRYQRLAKLSLEEFEKALEDRLSKVLSVLERSANPDGPKTRVRDEERAAPKRVLKAVAILAASGSSGVVDALISAGHTMDLAALSRAITFLNELANAFTATEHASASS